MLWITSLLLFFIRHTAGECPTSWTGFEDSCYRLETMKSTWFEANAICKLSQGHMVEITSSEEHHFITKFKHDSKADDRVWIGLSDFSTEGEFRWIMLEERTKFSAWAKGQPNGAERHVDQDCVCLEGRDAMWHDTECHRKYQFICEKSLRYSFLIG